MRRFCSFIITATLACLAVVPAQAVQYRTATDGREISAVISARETSRISLEGDRIRHLAKSDPEVIVEHNSENGDMFIAPAGPPLSKPVNLFVTSELGATYQLLLIPEDIPSEQLIIRNPSLIRAKKERNRISPRREEIAAIMRSMITGRTEAPYRRSGGGMLWLPPPVRGAEIAVLESWRGGDWEGMVFNVRVTRKTLRRAKMERGTALALNPHLFLPAAAVWIEKPTVQENTASRVVVVRNAHMEGGQ